VVSTKRSRAIRGEEASKTTIGGQEKKEEFEGKVYKKQKTFEPYKHLS
jgi:hypothetical protein